MAIALDTTTPVTHTAGATSLSWSHTCTGSNTILIVAMTVGNLADAEIITGITYNSVAMTKINRKFLAGQGNSSLWYLINPTTGSNTVLASLSSSVSIDGISASYTGVKQTSQPDAQTVFAATSTGFTQSTTTVADRTWMVWVCMNAGAQTTTMTSGATIRQIGNVNTDAYGDSNGAITPAQSYSMTAGGPGGSTSWIGVQASLVPFNPSVSLTQGSFALTGETVLFTKAHNYLLALAQGAYSLIGEVLSFSGPKWTKAKKDSTVFTNQPKD